jgi:hypothetical protein
MACLGEGGNALNFWQENLKGRGQLESLIVDGMIVLSIGKILWKVWAVFICLRIGTSGGLICSINCERFVI